MSADDPESSLDQQKPPQLSLLDSLLTLWILLAMVGGVMTGILEPSARSLLNTAHVNNVSLPIFVGLLLMLYPVFCKVRYENTRTILSHPNTGHYLLFSFLLNWILCPLIMAALSWALLPDLPGYRMGVMLIGVARCIAMVLIWNDLAGGDPEWCAILVAMNSILQMILFAPMAYFYTVTVGAGSGGTCLSGCGDGVVGMWVVGENVLIFLGIPFLAGFLTRILLRWALGAERYDRVFIPCISPLALLGLLYTIFIMFALQGKFMVDQLGSVFRVAIPLLLYFVLVWFMTMALSKQCRFPFPVAITQSFTAASNNFELALAIAIATFGADSQQALATTIGPLIEVPVMMGLVHATSWVGKYYNRGQDPVSRSASTTELQSMQTI